ncbi:hypothetical protein PVL29_015081 [Vitis rotundifolia]|uniref:RING-type domain-containing protein n=1 Tax=Vitis rotundifolia TaxID=103349 RepID=A0AA38ZBM6_VITRO|nr:hypothetical protein PVL29_015081 [Vitis rotundifolia]
MVDQQVEFLADFAEKFKEFSPDHDSFDDFLQDQEIVYQSLQASGLNNRNSNDDHCDQENRYSEEGQSSNAESVDFQLAVDEAIARSLMMEEEFVNVSISEPSGTAEGDTEVTENADVRSVQTSVAAVNQDNINPDNMTYEELQTLGESIGVESNGLSVRQIASLQHTKFKEKKGIFTTKRIHKECVICCMQFKHNEELITLSCKHDYHEGCIATWLKIRKNCPVCQREVEPPGF